MVERTKSVLKILAGVLIFIPIVMVIIWLPFFPEIIPAHYTGGIVDRYGSKYELLLFPMINVILLMIFVGAAFLIKRQVADKDKKSQGILALYITSVVCYLAFDIMTIYFTAKAYGLVERIDVNLYQVLSLVGALVFLVVGTLQLFSKPNSILGVRTAKTLSSPEVWKKVNLISGIIFIVSSIALIVFNFMYSNTFYNIIVFVGVSVLVSVISLILPKFINCDNKTVEKISTVEEESTVEKISTAEEENTAEKISTAGEESTAEKEST